MPGASEMQGVTRRPGTRRLTLKVLQGEVSLFDNGERAGSETSHLGSISQILISIIK